MDHTAITSVTEFTHIAEMQDELNKKLLESSKADLGRTDSLRATILQLVVGENYERAGEEMVAYVDLKTSYPNFQMRVQRLVQHCNELIQAIKTKRNFPGLAALSLAKQQEIHEKVLEHFEELKSHLRQVEKIERENKLDDLRSTVWVVRAFAHALVLIFVVAFLLDLKNGHFGSIVPVVGDVLDNASEWVVTHINI